MADVIDQTNEREARRGDPNSTKPDCTMVVIWKDGKTVRRSEPFTCVPSEWNTAPGLPADIHLLPYARVKEDNGSLLTVPLAIDEDLTEYINEHRPELMNLVSSS